MKTIIFAITLCLFLVPKAYATELSTISNTIDINIPDYLGTEIIPLNDKEKKALKLSNSWARKGAEPILTANGKLVYTHGSSLVTIVASPMQICDVELQQGESVNEIIIGDSARWFIEKGQAGNTTHLFIKPIDAGLETSAVVTTDRRVYHLRLISSRTDFTPYVGFIYANDLISYSAEKDAEAKKEELYTSTKIDKKQVDLASLNFNYRLKGNHSWKPTRIYDDGLKTYIQFPESYRAEMPILLSRKNKQDALINYRVKNHVMIADGTFEELVLVIGVGRHKEEVRIKRN